MRVTVQFNDGPISAEIEAEDGENFDEVLNELAEFVSDYYGLVNGELGNPRFDWSDMPEQATFEDIESDPDTVQEEKSDTSASRDTEHESEHSANSDDSESESVNEEADGDSPYRPIITETGLSESQLRKIIEIGNPEDGPRLLAGNFLPGDTKRELTLNGTIALLTLWSKCHDVFWVSTADIIDALEESGLKDDRFKRIYQADEYEKFLRKKGERRGTELGINPIGEDRGFELIEELAEEAGV
jgi:hypothetical protein